VPAFVGLGAPHWDAEARGGDLRPDAQFRDRPRSRRRRWRRSAIRPASCWRPCAPTGRRRAARCSGSMAA
jgi:hypothetical protein